MVKKFNKKVRAKQKNHPPDRKEYQQLRRLIEEVGEWNVNIYQLSKEWQIANSTLKRWKDQIVQDIGIIDINKIGHNLHHAMISNIKLCQRLKAQTDSKTTKLKVIRTMNDSVKSLTEFLENYGYKEKIAEKLEHINKEPIKFVINLDEPTQNDQKTKKNDKATE